MSPTDRLAAAIDQYCHARHSIVGLGDALIALADALKESEQA